MKKQRKKTISLQVMESQEGFSLLEVVIALAVIAIATLGVASVFITNRGLNEQTHQMSLASFAASEKLDQILMGIREPVNEKGQLDGTRETSLGVLDFHDDVFTVPGIGTNTGTVQVFEEKTTAGAMIGYRIQVTVKSKDLTKTLCSVMTVVTSRQ